MKKNAFAYKNIFSHNNSHIVGYYAQHILYSLSMYVNGQCKKKNKIYCLKELFAIILELIFFTSYSWMRLLFSFSNCNLIFCTVFRNDFHGFPKLLSDRKKNLISTGYMWCFDKWLSQKHWPLVEPKTSPFLFFWYDFWLSAYFFLMKKFIAHKSYVNTWISK